MARKKAATPRKGKARASAETTELQVEEAGPPKPPMTLESALVLVTFLALVVAFLLIQLELRSSFGSGWPV
jgi:hypothetical protein